VDTGEMLDNFPYRARAMFAFEEQDGVDVCFFGMHVQVPYPPILLIVPSTLQILVFNSGGDLLS